MRSKILSILALAGAFAFAGDTPFIRYMCTFKRLTVEKSFPIEFHNDDSIEVLGWDSEFKGTKLTFEKSSKESMQVSIVTGPPIVAQTSPAEYQFIAPLTTPSFHFVTGISPISINSQVFSLVCNKEQP